MSNAKLFLIVDDDQDDIDFFFEVMQKIDPAAVCISALDCECALDILRNSAEILPDIIFLDLNMPRMDGRQCLREMKKEAKFKDIPVIIYTTSSNPKDIAETRELGAVHFITKPSSFQALCDEISVALEMDLRSEQRINSM